MIRSHLILEIFDLFSFCNYSIISPESINTPSHIAISRASYNIPPRVDLSNSWIDLPPDIMPAINSTGVEPCSLKRMESYFPIIGLWPSEIDRMVGTVDIPTPEDTISEGSERVHIRRELSIKYELALPCLI